MTWWRRWSSDGDGSPSRPRPLPALPTVGTAHGAALTGFYFAEEERLRRHHHKSMVTMADGTPSQTYTPDGPAFTPTHAEQLELRERVGALLADAVVPEPERFPYGNPYAGWWVRDPWAEHEPRTLEDEPLLGPEVEKSPPGPFVLVSRGVVKVVDAAGLVHWRTDRGHALECYLMQLAVRHSAQVERLREVVSQQDGVAQVVRQVARPSSRLRRR